MNGIHCLVVFDKIACSFAVLLLTVCILCVYSY